MSLKTLEDDCFLTDLDGGRIMKITFRRALSLVCAISLLLTCLPVTVLSEEAVFASDIAPDLYEDYSFLVDESEYAPYDEEEPEAPVEEASEEPSEPVEQEAPAEPAATQEEPAPQPAVAQKASAEQTVESAAEVQENPEQESAEADQENADENIEAEDGNAVEETAEETADEATAESVENAPAVLAEEADQNTEITVTDEVWADRVIVVPENAEEADLTAAGDLEEGKEFVIRVTSEAETTLYFRLTSVAELQAVFVTENDEVRKDFTLDVTENPEGSEENEATEKSYSLAANFEQGSTGLIRIVSAVSAAFGLQVLTPAQQEMVPADQTEEESEEILVVPQTEKPVEPAKAENEPEGETSSEEQIVEVPTFEIKGDILVHYNGEDEDVVVPEGIQEIGTQAFQGNETLKTVTLPDSVEIINNAAFADCVNLEQVIRSEQSLLITIGNGAFRNDAKLDITFAENIPNVLINAFEGAGIAEEAEETEETEENEETEAQEDEETEEAEEETEPQEAEETEEETEEEPEEPSLVFEGEDFTVTVVYGEEAGFPEGTELTVTEILPETEEYEAYFNLTEEERAPIWNAVTEQGRLFLIAFRCGEEEVAPQAPIEVKVQFPADEQEPEILWAESPLTFEGEDFTVTVSFTEEAQLPQGTELTVRELLPETEEYEAYINLTEEEKAAIWNVVAEQDRLFLIAFVCNEEEIAPQAAIDVQVQIAVEEQEEEEQKPEVLWAESPMVFEGPDYTVTVNFNDDAQFPQGTELRVREILPGTEEYRLYSGQTEDVLNENWDTTAEFARFFDITFIHAEEVVAEEEAEAIEEAETIEETEATEETEETVEVPEEEKQYVEKEIEPQAPIDVQITFAETIAVATDQEEELQVQAIHFDEEEGAKLIESEAQSVEEVAVADEAVVDTVAFSSDSFSVYGFVQTAKITESVISADGHTYKIEVTYGQDSEIPMNAELTVEEILPGTEQYNTLLQEALKATRASKTEEAGEVEATQEAEENAEETVEGDAEETAEEESESETVEVATEEAETIPVAEDQYARFFDIEIKVDGEKKEPSSNVSVSISLADMPVATAEELAVVHFVEEGTEVLDAKSEGTESIQFETNSFSVYAVITVPSQPQGTDDLTGRMFRIKQNGRYMTSKTHKPTNNVDFFQNTANAEDAVVWHFEDADETGKYYIFTFDDYGEKRYLSMKTHGSTELLGDVIFGDISNRKAFSVSASDNTYTISTVLSNTDFYLLEESEYYGFAAEPRSGHNRNLTLEFTQDNVVTNGQKYVMIIKYGDTYYSVLNDGYLEEVEFDEANQMAYVETPMLWTYTGDHLYHPAAAAGFNSQSLASSYFYRYIDPRQPSGLNMDDSSNTTVHEEVFYDWDHRWLISDGDRTLWNNVKISYNASMHSITATGDSTAPLKVIEDGGRLKIAGGDSVGPVAEVYLAKYTAPNYLHVGPKYHTVDHIDISVEARAGVNIPLAYGTYYYVEGGVVKTLVASGQNPVTLSLSKDNVEVDRDDLKKGTITAYTKDNYGNHIPKDNAFYIISYSANSETSANTNQIRIGGAFKVADLPAVAANSSIDQNNDLSAADDGIGEQRLKHRIYYTVSTTKEVEFNMEYNGHQLYTSAEDARASMVVGYDVENDDNALKVNPTITLSASFDYWDLRNECPGIHDVNIKFTQNWLKGGILSNDDEDGVPSQNSGMDFALGTAEQSEATIKAIEITKFIVDKNNVRIHPQSDVQTQFYVYTKKFTKDDNPNPIDAVKNLDVDAYDQADARNANVNSGYTKQHVKKVTVGEDGMGIVYDYDMSDSLVYIEEDKSPTYLPAQITDNQGRIWNYSHTYIETEYVWRGDGIENRRHVSPDYTTEDEHYNSIPDVVGTYRDIDGIDRHNGFLEFYVYNVYEPEDIDITVEKVWVQENGRQATPPEEGKVTVTLERYHLVEDEAHPVTGSLKINQTVNGLLQNRSFEATYLVKKGDTVIKTGSFSAIGNGDTITGSTQINGLPGGNYTVEIISAADNLDVTNEPASTTVTVVNGKTTIAEADFTTTCTAKTTPQTVTINVTNSIDGVGVYQNLSYVFPANSSVVVRISRPGPAHSMIYDGQRSFQASVLVDGVDLYEYPTGESYASITEDLTFGPFASGEHNINIWHTWGKESLWVNSVSLPEEPSTAGQTVPDDDEEDDSETPGSSQYTDVDPDDKAPDSPLLGMKYEVDTDGEGIPWSQVVILYDGLWKRTIEDLPAVDDNGHDYLYFIQSVEEENMPTGTHATINLAQGGKTLTSTGDTILKVTNTVPNQPIKLSIKKVDENNIPMTGVTFALFKNDVKVKDFTITSGDGIYTLDGLTNGDYKITETSTLTGYQGLKSSIKFSVTAADSGSSVSYTMVPGDLPEDVTFDGDTFCYNVVNKPDAETNAIVIRKQWLDCTGNVLASPDFDEINVTLKRALLSRDTKYLNIIVDLPGRATASNTHIPIISDKVTVSWYDNAQFSWNAGRLSHSESADIELTDRTVRGGESTNAVWELSGLGSVSSDEVTVTFTYAPTSESDPINDSWFKDTIRDTTIVVNPVGDPDTSADSFSETISITSSNNWYVVKTVGGAKGQSSSAAYDYPATDEAGNAYSYYIVEESVPSGYTVSFSSDNASGIQYSGVLTAYNKKDAWDVVLVKVDKYNNETKLEGAQFELSKILPGSATIAYDRSFTTQTKTTANDGALLFKNLDIGYYEVKEKVAPEGYLPIQDGAFYFKITTTGVYLLRKTTDKPSQWPSVRRTNGITFTNGVFTVPETPDGILPIKKIVTGENLPDDAQTTKTFPITVTLARDDDVAPNETFTATSSDTTRNPMSIMFNDGVATVNVKHNETITITGIPRGWTYTVTEDLSGSSFIGYAKTSPATDPTGTISESTSVVEITNTYELVDIVATKTWQDPTGTSSINATIKNAEVTYTLYKKVGTGAWVEATTVENHQKTMSVQGTADEEAWEVQWSDLPKYESGQLVSYKVVETGAKLNNVNMILPETTEVTTSSFEDVDEHENQTAVVNLNNPLPGIDIKIVKVDETSRGATLIKLTGAKFQMLRKDGSEYVKFVNPQFETDSTNSNLKTGNFEIQSENGILIEDLIPGDYKMTETKAPDGYNLANVVIEFTINADGTVSYDNVEGDVITYDDKTDEDPFTFTIGNTPGVELPSTGGNGILWYNRIGLALILLAGALLIVNRRRAAKERR